MTWIITKNYDAIELEQGQNVFYPDTITDIDYQITNRVTEHPVVADTNKTDHFINELDRIVLRGCVAGTALRKDASDLFAGADSRTAAACELFAQMAKQGECVNLITDQKDYGQMLVEDARVSFQQGDIIQFDLSLKEFRAVTLQDVQIQIGQIVQRGEISTVEGQPDINPFAVNDTDTERAEREARLVAVSRNPDAFGDCDELPPGAEADACYEEAFRLAFES